MELGSGEDAGGGGRRVPGNRPRKPKRKTMAATIIGTVMPSHPIKREPISDFSPDMARKKNRMPRVKAMAIEVVMKAPAVHPMMLRILFMVLERHARKHNSITHPNPAQGILGGDSLGSSLDRRFVPATRQSEQEARRLTLRRDFYALLERTGRGSGGALLCVGRKGRRKASEKS